jgi:hypothetical protein
MRSRPPLHHDPFDRLLIAQAQHECLTLATRDPDVRCYTINTLWGKSATAAALPSPVAALEMSQFTLVMSLLRQ